MHHIFILPGETHASTYISTRWAPSSRRIRSWLRSPCSTLVQVRISAAPPRCSPDTRLGKKPRGCASGEQWGGAAEILTRTGVEHGKRRQLRIRRLSRKCRKRYG
jgi:hypothetical protein